MSDIVAGLFGLTPYQVQQQQYQNNQNYAEKVAGMDGFEQAKFGIGQGAAGIAGGMAGMMGGVNVAQEQAARQQGVMQGADTSTPEGLMAVAKRFHESGMPQQAAMAVQAARQMAAEQQKMATERQKMATDASMEQKNLALADKALRDESNPFAKIDPKDYTPASVRAYMLSKNPADLRAIAKAGGAGAEKPMTAQQRVKFENQMSDDYKSTEQVMQTMDNLQKSISDISSSKGLGARTGYTGYLPAWSQGQEAKIAQNRIDTLKGKVTQMGKAMASMSGAIGPMAVQEWKIVSDAVNALDPTADNFSEQLANINGQSIGTAKRIKDVYERQYSDYYSKYPKLDSSNLKVYGAGDDPAQPKTVVREVKLKDGRVGVEYSDGTRGFK